jgi:hypothetical protein
LNSKFFLTAFVVFLYLKMGNMAKAMVDTICNQLDFNLAYAKKLVEDLTEQQMITQPAKGFENHPAFTIGHLVSGSALTVEDLGGKFEMPEGWEVIFLRKGPGDPTLPIAVEYPAKNTLLAEFENQHNKLKATLNKTTPEKLLQPVKWRFDTYMPILLDVVIFMCINHEAMHLGQLSAWRRAMELSSALGDLK